MMKKIEKSWIRILSKDLVNHNAYQAFQAAFVVNPNKAWYCSWKYIEVLYTGMYNLIYNKCVV